MPVCKRPVATVQILCFGTAVWLPKGRRTEQRPSAGASHPFSLCLWSLEVPMTGGLPCKIKNGVSGCCPLIPPPGLRFFGTQQVWGDTQPQE